MTKKTKRSITPFSRTDSPPRFPFKRDRQFELPEEYAAARERCPVAPVTLWNEQRAWLLTRHEHFRKVLLDHRFSGEFAHEDFPTVTQARRAIDKLERAFVGMDSPRHGHFRRMFTKEFTTKRMLALRPQIETLTDRLLDEMAAKGPPTDLVADLAVELPALVMCDLFGSPYEDHIYILKCAAGHDTATNMIALGALLLLEHPDQLELFKSDPALTDSAVEELLRFLSPVQFAPRRVALEDVEIAGSTIGKGDGVYAVSASANRDPDAFHDPDRLDITRDASHHVTFGFRFTVFTDCRSNGRPAR